ncbi:anti-sigma-V factor RsiV [Paenibacillus sp. J31TS4]|uniref:RsiV family protein n=1 Tax=Paenibacillus sp. J31TS4 TaxID=2807195 RepID=UPI001B227A90|nr:RsiV family protein [Paenibacillus sp. J31TS4]GIP39838.1 anti-sigma-V factor RsiV [Paenibacillus sp. J31TS4]
MDRRLEQLKQEYSQVPIPEELDFVVREALNQTRRRKPVFRKYMAGVGAAAIVLVAGINMSPALAQPLSEVPVVGSIVKVLTFREYKIDNGTTQANIQVPAITNLENKTLEQTLNNKYLEESKKLYDDFIVEMNELKQKGGGHMGVDSGYVVKTDTDRILAVGRYVVNTVGSSSTTFKYDTIDKENQVLLTLPGLFRDDQYINLISETIKEQMREQMKADPQKIYWVEGTGNEMPESNFKAIAPDQSFYINKDGKLVIVFDKYEVAPGYMGVVEFTILTSALADVLVSNEYIK